MTRGHRDKKSLSDEDRALFRSTMQGVKPLNHTARVAPEPEFKPSKIHKPSRSTNLTPPLSNTPKTQVSAESVLCHDHQSIPKKRLSQLRKGLIPCEGRLDLHGLRLDEAREALCAFIELHFNAQKRSLLIIHGKGQDKATLKNHVNHWLQQLPQVLAFHSATPKDGGTGALYVLLKRQRPTIFQK